MAWFLFHIPCCGRWLVELLSLKKKKKKRSHFCPSEASWWNSHGLTGLVLDVCMCLAALGVVLAPCLEGHWCMYRVFLSTPISLYKTDGKKKEGEGACQHDIGHLWRKRVSCCMCSPVTGRCSFQGAVGNAAGVDSEPANECKLHYLWSSPGTQRYQGYYFFLVFSLLRKSVNLLLAWPVLINNSYISVLAQEWKLVRNSQPIICFTLPCICPRQEAWTSMTTAWTFRQTRVTSPFVYPLAQLHRLSHSLFLWFLSVKELDS